MCLQWFRIRIENAFIWNKKFGVIPTTSFFLKTVLAYLDLHERHTLSSH